MHRILPTDAMKARRGGDLCSSFHSNVNDFACGQQTCK